MVAGSISPPQDTSTGNSDNGFYQYFPKNTYFLKHWIFHLFTFIHWVTRNVFTFLVNTLTFPQHCVDTSDDPHIDIHAHY